MSTDGRRLAFCFVNGVNQLYQQESSDLAVEENDDDDDDDMGEVLTLPLQAHHAMEKMEEFVHKV